MDSTYETSMGRLNKYQEESDIYEKNLKGYIETMVASR